MLEPVRPIALADIEEARARIAGTVLRTPLVKLDGGGNAPEIHLKLENLQPTNAYKIRGATNAVARLSEEERARGVVHVDEVDRRVEAAAEVDDGVAWQACLLERSPWLDRWGRSHRLIMGLLPQWVKTHWPNYVEGCRLGGRAADPANWRVAKSVFVADDLATARRYATAPEGPYHHYYRTLGSKLIRYGRANLFKADPTALDSAVTAEGMVDDLVIWGTPDKVVDELLAFRETIGAFGTLLYASHDWVDKKLAVRSMELMVDKVMPAIDAATRTAAG